MSEITAGRIGSATVITKLSELLFVEAVSQFVANLPAERRGRPVADTVVASIQQAHFEN